MSGDAQLLRNTVRTYAWGSHSVLPALLGESVPSAEPWAEIWMGAHPDDPSRLADGRTLDEVVPDLPFLVKLLAADQPLSIQAHPNLEQARAGYAAEEAAGVPHSAPERRYKDPNHKPELMVALTDVSALCGFRAPTDSLAFVELLAVPELSALARPLTGPDAREGWRAVLLALIDRSLVGREKLVADVTDRSAELLRLSLAIEADVQQLSLDQQRTLGWIGKLATKYPGDPGVLAPLFLRLVQLAPGAAVFLGAGQLHAYLHGAGVEVQASSDNVLRGALTSKYVDSAELLRVVDFSPGRDPAVQPRAIGPGIDAYDVPVADFVVQRVRPSGLPLVVSAAGDRIVVCVAGEVRVAGVELRPGQAAFVPAGVNELTLGGTGTAFVASPGGSR